MNIIDTTLREGEQTPGITFSLAEKKEIIDLLVKIGVEDIEIGLSSPLSPCPEKLAVYLRGHYPNQNFSIWSRCKSSDIYHAARISPTTLSLSIPVSDIHLIEKLDKNRAWAKRTMIKSLLLAQKMGLTAGIGFEDSSRADISFLNEMATLASSYGVKRIRLADTVGIWSPQDTLKFVKRIKKLVSCEVGVHCHNDFGMATGNSIAALKSDADFADATVLGLGERTGCAKLEEIAGYFTLHADGKYNIKEVRNLAKRISTITHAAILPNHPILGSRIFTCETGLHLQGLQKNPATYEPYPPEKVGLKRNLILSSKAGRRAILQYLSKWDNPPEFLSDGQMIKIRSSLKEKPLL